MGKKIEIWHGRALFHCPGCDKKHQVIIDGTRGWTWNNNETAPTFTPSILVQTRDFTPKGQADFDAWHAAGCPTLPEGHQFENAPIVCHSYVTDGRIQFLPDCTHSLAGKTVELPDYDE